MPDVGIFAGTDIVAVEQASIDAIKTEDYMTGRSPTRWRCGTWKGHLLQKIHSKDPYLQCEEAANEGLGSQEYDLTEVE